ncbi:MAG: 4Fe-4S ferredoxin [bacterium]
MASLHSHGFECPGSRMQDFQDAAGTEEEAGTRRSQLKQWPIQLHLVSPQAPYYQGADVLLTADCVAYALGDFHKDHLRGKSLAIACPKLDEGQEVYVEKIKGLLENAKINTLTVMIMEVPCCMGLLGLAQEASREASRKVPIKCVTVGIRGDVLSEEWV